MSQLDADPYGNDLPARLNTVLDANQYLPTHDVYADKYLPTPDVDIKVDSVCPKARVVMAPHSKHVAHVLPEAPIAPDATRAMPVAFEWKTPSNAFLPLALSAHQPKAFTTYFKQNGKTKTFFFTGMHGKASLEFKFDAKKFLADQKMLAEQVKTQNWAQWKSNEATLESSAATMRMDDGKDGVIVIDSAAAAAIDAAQKAARRNVDAALRGMDVDLQGVMKLDGTAKN
jgi:hypothetical protein